MAGNIYKRGKVYWARIVVAGREYRGSLQTASRAEALKKLGDFRKRHGRAKHTGTRLTWTEASVHYMGAVLPTAVSANTGKRYKVSLNSVKPHLERYHVDEIGPMQISELIAARRLDGAKNATINRDLTAVSRVLSAAISVGATEQNAARDYDRRTNRERRDPIELPTWDEVAAAIEKAPTPLWARIMDFASKSGMRENEILTLEKKRVDLARGAVTLHRTKGRRLRAVPLTGPLLEDAVPILRAAMDRKQELVFGRPGERELKNFPSRYAAWRRKHGIGFRFHDLRHLFAVTYLQRGGNIYDLQRILGHGSIKTTEVYLDYLTPAERRGAMGSAHNQAQL